MAEKLVARLHPKWKPTETETGDNLTLTRSRKQRNELEKTRNGRVTFNPTIEDGPRTEQAIRVFAGPPSLPNHAIRRPPRPFQVQGEETEVYTDGSCTQNGEASATAGSGLWFGEDDHRNNGFRVPGMQSNQTAELYAVEKAVDMTPPFAPLHVVTDSKYVIRGLTENLGKWERDGWMNVENAEEVKRLTGKLRKRSAPTTFRWVKGHEGNRGNEEADRLAKIGANRLDVHPPTRTDMVFLRRGMQLSTATQKLLYLGIRKQKAEKAGERPRTQLVLERVCEAVHSTLKFKPRPSIIWKSLRSKDINRKAREFLWKGLHDAHRVGKFWENIPTLEHRAICSLCGEEESLEHILTECSATCVRTVWGLVRALANKKGLTLPRLNFGTIMAGHVFKMTYIMDKPPKGADRLMRIAITESAYLIWKIRCERVIEREGDPQREHTVKEVSSRWHATMARRQALDFGQTNKRFGRKALERNRVECTWSQPQESDESVGLGEVRLAKMTGVLVGRLEPEYGDVR
ncbi:ribonuclease H-like protein [Ganoderma leucocontextum]|nr:ribonuclease H-like protein [Ganoderma leucocontextum]